MPQFLVRTGIRNGIAHAVISELGGVVRPVVTREGNWDDVRMNPGFRDVLQESFVVKSVN